jgi:adenosylcobinamide-GDP ribazoletransferase
MRRQLHLFLCAIQFLTRLPVPALKNFEAEWITRSALYFPVVGIIVGGLCGLMLMGASYIWAGALPILLALGVGILVTGAFHEDGLADTADGLGGGHDKNHRLAIMKDSRIGTYGALALVLCFSLKFAALASFQPHMAAMMLLAAHAAGRAVAVVVMGVLPYAGEKDTAKSKPVAVGVKPWEYCVGLIFGVLPLVLLPVYPALTGIVAGSCLALLMAITARRLIGGYTGDVLGAVEQVFEIGFLLGASAAL